MQVGILGPAEASSDYWTVVCAPTNEEQAAAFLKWLARATQVYKNERSKTPMFGPEFQTQVTF